MEENNFLCKYCGDPLEYGDTYDIEGGIENGRLLERQLWSCHRCDIDYIIEQECELCKPQIMYFEEA